MRLKKKYFLQNLENDSIITDIFLPDVTNGATRNSIALKSWAGSTIAAKSTRVTFNAPGGERAYDVNERKLGFQEADKHAARDKIIRAGVEVVPILELVIREQKMISLEGAEPQSAIWRYIKSNSKAESIRKDDLVLCKKDESEE